MKLLVAIDLSRASARVLAVARRWAELASAEVRLLHVAEPEPDFVGFEPGPQKIRDRLAVKFHREHQILQQHAENFRESGIAASALLIQGPTRDTILKESSKLEADMIVIGSHGHTALRHLLMGSVSEGIVKKSKCPVLVVPTRGSGRGKRTEKIS